MSELGTFLIDVLLFAIVAFCAIGVVVRVVDDLRASVDLVLLTLIGSAALNGWLR